MARPLWLQAAADDFWRAAGEVEPFPRNLESPVLWALPLFIVKVPRLSVADLRDRLAAYGIEFKVDSMNRSLHGCLIAFAGKGVVMLDGSDPQGELRFSLAHEVGHFLTDYQQPRRRALGRLGPDIVGVLDGLRPPKREERIDAVLSDVRIGVHMHLMDRSPSGTIGCGRIAGSEFRADRLAFELLAPEEAVLAITDSAADCSVEERRTSMENVLVGTFGLPIGPARQYARFLATVHERSLSLRAWLGMGTAGSKVTRSNVGDMSKLPADARKTQRR